jgi:sugar O-acyltransferase (sialic acid O-acetyltransferase NeuD family)
MKQLAIFGCGGHGRVVAELAEMNGFDKVVCFDDSLAPVDGQLAVGGGRWTVGGNMESLLMRLPDYYACVVAIGNNAVRAEKQALLKSHGALLATLIHPSAVVSKYTEVGEGTVVMANAVVNTFAKVGAGCIVNSGAVVEHDCRIGDFVLLDSNVTIGGGATIGDCIWIKLGETVGKGVEVRDQSGFGIYGAKFDFLQGPDCQRLAHGGKGLGVSG